MACEIHPITAEETVSLRAALLRQGMPLEAARFDGDDAEGTQHFGAFVDGAQVGVGTVLRARAPGGDGNEEAWQVRGMAVLPEIRRQGCGRALLQACVDHACEHGATLVWCNARIGALGLYRNFGFSVKGTSFVIADAGPHFVMLLPLVRAAT